MQRQFSRLVVLVRRILLGCKILVGSVLVRVRGGQVGIAWPWFAGRSMRSLCAFELASCGSAIWV